MAKVTVDGIEVEVPNGASVLQACEAAGKEIPRFCYHERLSRRRQLPDVPGRGREGAEADRVLRLSRRGRHGGEHRQRRWCATARRGVMEFLLINHPLDCPICDQGGECDLQDQAVGLRHGPLAATARTSGR